MKEDEVDPHFDVDIVGEGQPVMLIHGFLEEKGMWSFFLPELEHRKVILPDLPGHGENKNIAVPETIEDFADLMADLLEATGEESADIIGHSMGGYIAAAVAEKYPDKVRSLCFFHSSAGEDPEEKKTARSQAIEVVQKDHRKYVRGMITGLFEPSRKEELAEAIEALIKSAGELAPEVITACLSAMRDRRDHQKVLRDSGIPVAYLLGDRDAALPNERMKKEVESVQPDQHLFLEGVGHMSQLEAPQAAMEFLKKWLETNAQS